MSKKKKRKIIIIAAAFLCLLLAAGYTVIIKPRLNQEKWVYKEEIVEKGTLTVGVTESGSLEYGITSQLYELDLAVTDESSDDDEEEEETEKYLKVEEVYIAPGQRILEGDALLKFTDSSVSDVRRLLEAAQTEAEITYSETQSEYNLSVLSAELSYKSDLAVAKYADSIYKYESQVVSDNISTLQLELTSAQENTESLQESYDDALETYNDALEEYEAAKELLSQVGDNVYVMYQEIYLRAKSNYESAQSRLEQAEQSITDNADKIADLAEQIEAAKAKQTINRLEAEQTKEEDILTGEVSEISYNAELEALKETLAEAEEELEDAREQVAAFDAFVGEDGVVYAKGSGMVTEVGYEAGDTLTTHGTVVSFAQAEDMTITVDVSQEDIISISVGDTVKISFAAYEDAIYEGEIAAMEITNTAAGNTVSYPVTISVKGDTSALYGGMTADVTFVTEEKTDICYISKKAIVEENGKTYVYVDNLLGKKVLTEVETGLSNGVSVEIISGLSEGDIYYIASRVTEEAENSSSTESTGTTDGMTFPEGMFDGEGMPDFEDMQNGGMPDFGNMPGGSGQMGGRP